MMALAGTTMERKTTVSRMKLSPRTKAITIGVKRPIASNASMTDGLGPSHQDIGLDPGEGLGNVLVAKPPHGSKCLVTGWFAGYRGGHKGEVSCVISHQARLAKEVGVRRNGVPQALDSCLDRLGVHVAVDDDLCRDSHPDGKLLFQHLKRFP